ncbi:major facilitator superfamily domain-containing protein [Mycena sanguinolenta]|nr:major facilitator superfamily domain-containing protein [Mycena sanguinolenta]
MPAGFISLPLAESDMLRGSTVGSARILGPRWAHLPTLTIGLLGAQILWSVEMSYAPPYLISLGLSRASMAIVFLAGPLSGFLVQPLIGVLADNSTSRWGRRRPFMLAGCAVCAASMLLLGYTREVVEMLLGRENSMNGVVTEWLAILAIYLVDFAINAVQAVDRALLIDTLPPSLQASGNAWAALMLGVGGVVGFFVGNLDLPDLLPFLGSSELQVLSVLVVSLIIGGHLVTALLVKEAVLVRTDDLKRLSFRAELHQFWTRMWTLPLVIQQIFMIQFFAWLGWFPCLFYTTMYISDLHARSASAQAAFDYGTPGLLESDLAEEGTRLGARALFFCAMLALLTNLVLPPFTTTSSYKSMLKARIPKIPLVTVWMGGHLLFSACMLATFAVSTVEGATWVTMIMGVPLAITQWAPFALLGEAILTSQPNSDTGEVDPLLEQIESGAKSSSLDLSSELERLDMRPPNAAHREVNTNSGGGGLRDQVGVILGIHNICIVIPQFLVTILCAVVFAIFDGSTAEKSSNQSSVVYVFRLGAIWSFIAFMICRRLARLVR